MVRENTAQSVTLRAVTDVGGLTHLVSDEAIAAGRRAGCYAAVCGNHVLAASLTALESGRCQDCRRLRAGR